MRRLLSSAFVTLTLVSFSNFGLAAQQKSKEVQIGISDVFVPRDFDSRSIAYVVVSGFFPNGCYQWSRADVDHLPDKIHEIRSYASVKQGLCEMVMVPFSKDIQLGQLEVGVHKIRFLNGDGTFIERPLTIDR